MEARTVSFIYLASPYSHEMDTVKQQRYELVSETVVQLLKQDIHVYSPIVHCHELAKRFNLSGSFAFWQDYNFAMIEASAGLWVLKLEGWKESIGVKAEIKYAIAKDIDYTAIPYPLVERINVKTT